MVVVFFTSAAVDFLAGVLLDGEAFLTGAGFGTAAVFAAAVNSIRGVRSIRRNGQIAYLRLLEARAGAASAASSAILRFAGIFAVLVFC